MRGGGGEGEEEKALGMQDAKQHCVQSLKEMTSSLLGPITKLEVSLGEIIENCFSGQLRVF